MKVKHGIKMLEEAYSNMLKENMKQPESGAAIEALNIVNDFNADELEDFLFGLSYSLQMIGSDQGDEDNDFSDTSGLINQAATRWSKRAGN